MLARARPRRGQRCAIRADREIAGRGREPAVVHEGTRNRRVTDELRGVVAASGAEASGSALLPCVDATDQASLGNHQAVHARLRAAQRLHLPQLVVQPVR